MTRTYLPRSWIHPALFGGPSQIHDEGVFTTQPIARGEKLMEFGGARIDTEQASSEDYWARSVWIVTDGVYLARPITDESASLDENLNHACDANAWLADEVTLVARRDIAAGEEITLDQGTWNFDDAEFTWDGALCSCGVTDCRGALTENDWQLAAVQQRYAGHFHPVIQAMIDRRRKNA
jgi:hypothetical protein